MNTGQNLFKKILVNDKEVNISEIDANNGIYSLEAGTDKAIVKFILKDNTVIPANVFNNNKYISRVIIPNSVKSIAPNAFNGNTNISYIFIPDSVDQIGDYAFGGVELANSYLDIINKIKSINTYAFNTDIEPFNPTGIEDDITDIEDDITDIENDSQQPNSNPSYGKSKRSTEDLIDPIY